MELYTAAVDGVFLLRLHLLELEDERLHHRLRAVDLVVLAGLAQRRLDDVACNRKQSLEKMS